MKTLLLDIETAPNTAHVWGLFDQTVSLNQLLESSYVLCWAAKWLDDPQVLFERTHKKNGSSKSMIQQIHRLVESADTVITYNGIRFDIPTLNKEFLLHGLTPPAPVNHIDLIRTARCQFRFVSNKLDYVAQILGVGKKVQHEGHTLWVNCMAGKPDAWATMEKYNKQDVVILEKVYRKLIPWIKGHASHAVRNEHRLVCPQCGKAHYQQRGFQYSRVGKYARFQCLDCASWFRANVNELEARKVKFLPL